MSQDTFDTLKRMTLNNKNIDYFDQKKFDIDKSGFN